MTESWIFKIMALGSSGAGKTSYFQYIGDNCRLIHYYDSSLGTNFLTLRFEIKNTLNCALQIWDTRGGGRHRELIPDYCKGATACLLFFDTTDYNSYSDLIHWIRIVRKNAGDIPIYLIGTKMDLNYEITSDEILSFINEYNLEGYFPCSIHLGFNHEVLFKQLVEKIMGLRESPEINPNFEASVWCNKTLPYERRKRKLFSYLQIIRDPIYSNILEYEMLHTPLESSYFANSNAIKSDFTTVLQEQNNQNSLLQSSSSNDEIYTNQDDLESQEIPRSIRDEMLEELERLRTIMRGGPPEEDVALEYLSEEERMKFQKFSEFFVVCPVCQSMNHQNYLRRFYFSTDAQKTILREHLLHLMDESEDFEVVFNAHITLGIPCCSCHDTFFQ